MTKKLIENNAGHIGGTEGILAVLGHVLLPDLVGLLFQLVREGFPFSQNLLLNVLHLLLLLITIEIIGLVITVEFEDASPQSDPVRRRELVDLFVGHIVRNQDRGGHEPVCKVRRGSEDTRSVRAQHGVTILVPVDRSLRFFTRGEVLICNFAVGNYSGLTYFILIKHDRLLVLILSF